MAAKDDETAAAWLSSFWGTKSPKGNRTAAVLREPALEFALRGVVRQTAEVKDLGALTKEGTDVASGVKRSMKYVHVTLWIVLARPRLLNQGAQASGERQCLLEGAAWRRRCKGLQVERKATGDFARRADLLDFQTCTD